MENKGIWKYVDLLQPSVSSKFQLSLKEGNTPLESIPELAKALNLESIYIKREDMNPTGSHKDRGLAFEISAHLQEGSKEFVMSSSGNAAISAIHLLKGSSSTLHIFLSNNLSVSKVNRLVKAISGKVSSDIFKGKDTDFENLHFHFSQKPLSTAFSFAKENNFVLLRGSTDEYGYEGFKTMAYEIAENFEDFDSIFIPISSGTTAKGIYEGFKEKNFNIPFHLIQTTKVNTLVHRFDSDYQPSITSIADSIVDRIGHRVKDVEEIIKETGGTGWILNDKQIQEAQMILEDLELKTSNESAMTIAAIQKAKENGWDIKKPICIFTGSR
jgi:threonine synthase